MTKNIQNVKLFKMRQNQPNKIPSAHLKTSNIMQKKPSESDHSGQTWKITKLSIKSKQKWENSASLHLEKLASLASTFPKANKYASDRQLAAHNDRATSTAINIPALPATGIVIEQQCHNRMMDEQQRLTSPIDIRVRNELTGTLQG